MKREKERYREKKKNIENVVSRRKKRRQMEKA